MLASATFVNNAKLKAQQGFSLIELLVVVAIIGVLAAAGIVGYQSYLDGVKKDTQKNNVLSITRALDLANPARSGELSGTPDGCKRSDLPAVPDATYRTSLGAGVYTEAYFINKVLTCVTGALGKDNAPKFASPFDSTKKGVGSTGYIRPGGVKGQALASAGPGTKTPSGSAPSAGASATNQYASACDGTAANIGVVFVHANSIQTGDGSPAATKNNLEIILEPCGANGSPIPDLFGTGATARLSLFD